MTRDPYWLYHQRQELERQCDQHDVSFWRIKIPGPEARFSEFCPKCQEEANEQRQQELIKDAQLSVIYRSTYDVLMRDSHIPAGLADENFETFLAETSEEAQLLAFAKGQVEKYLDGMVGNTLFSGQTGIGKTHMCWSMAKALNEGFKVKGEPKRVLFVSLTELIKEIKDGWNYGKGAKLTEQEAVRRLVKADYLFLDDLGAKNTVVSPKGDWEQDLLFDILNQRQTTIINTNLNAEEMKTVYNQRNASRIFSGLDGNIFKAFTIQDKRYGLNALKERARKT